MCDVPDEFVLLSPYHPHWIVVRNLMKRVCCVSIFPPILGRFLVDNVFERTTMKRIRIGISSREVQDSRSQVGPCDQSIAFFSAVPMNWTFHDARQVHPWFVQSCLSPMKRRTVVRCIDDYCVFVLAFFLKELH